MHAASPSALTETLPAAPQSVPKLRIAVARYAAAAGVTGHTLDRLTLSVSEAVTNVVMHAYADRGEPGAVTVTASLEGDRVMVTVIDGGRGMRPRLDSPGMGLGLPLIAHFADAFDVQRSAGGGTEMHMSFPVG